MTDKLVPTEMMNTYDGQGSIQPVVKVEAIPPAINGNFRASGNKLPIADHLYAVKVTLADGHVRWFGFEHAFIGSDLRMHVGPVNPRDEVRNRWPDA